LTDVILVTNSVEKFTSIKMAFNLVRRDGMSVHMEAQQKIGVFVIEKNPISRQGTYSAISEQKDIEIVGQAGSNEEALSMAADILPRTVVVHAIPPKGSFGLVHRLSELSPEVSVIVLAEYEDDEELFHAIMAGASAFLTKGSSEKQLFSTIRNAFSGECPLAKSVLSRPGVASRILERFHELSSSAMGLEPLVAPLSSREEEVLKLIADGISTQTISSSLNTGERAIEGNVKSILHKLNVNERTRSAVVALLSYGKGKI